MKKGLFLLIVVISILFLGNVNAQDISYKKIYPTKTFNFGKSEDKFEYVTYWDLFINTTESFYYKDCIMQYRIGGLEQDIIMKDLGDEIIPIVENIRLSIYSGWDLNYVEKETEFYFANETGMIVKFYTSNLPNIRIAIFYDNKHSLYLKDVEIYFKNKKYDF